MKRESDEAIRLHNVILEAILAGIGDESKEAVESAGYDLIRLTSEAITPSLVRTMVPLMRSNVAEPSNVLEAAKAVACGHVAGTIHLIRLSLMAERCGSVR